MQLAPSDELVLVSGIPPIRARKVKYFEDKRLSSRVVPPPALRVASARESNGTPVTGDDWANVSAALPVQDGRFADKSIGDPDSTDDFANGGIRREPALPEHEAIAPEVTKRCTEFDFADDAEDHDVVSAKAMNQNLPAIARQATLDPADGLGM
jgi:type IV secretion system protein VirD4